jgi:hypothetical protein
VQIHTALFFNVIFGLSIHKVISGCISKFIGTNIGSQGSGGHSSSGGTGGSTGGTGGSTGGTGGSTGGTVGVNCGAADCGAAGVVGSGVDIFIYYTNKINFSN